MNRLYKHEDVVQMLVDVIEQIEENEGIEIVDRPMGWESVRDYAEEVVSDIPSAESKGEWIPCSERLPDNIRPVLVTWKNNDPASYYQYIAGKHFIGTAHYYRGKWYWYSSVTEDLLVEYGECETEECDEAIEVVAWMPLPEPWKGADNEGVR